MKNSTKTLALSAIIAAAEIAVLFAGSIAPGGRLALAAVAGTANFITYIECGKRNTFLVYAAVSILGIFLLPLKAPGVLYLAFFGYYPVVKSMLERLGKIRLEWLLKMLLALVSLTVMVFIYNAGFMSGAEIPHYALWIIYIGCVAAFVVYDFLLSRLVEEYIKRKMKKM